jgi:hypothetical protein
MAQLKFSLKDGLQYDFSEDEAIMLVIFTILILGFGLVFLLMVLHP